MVNNRRKIIAYNKDDNKIYNNALSDCIGGYYNIIDLFFGKLLQINFFNFAY